MQKARSFFSKSIKILSKILKNLLPFFVTSKQSRVFFQIFVAFSECLNFKSWKTYLQTVEDFEFEKIREKPRKCSNTNPQVLKQRVKGIREQNESLRKKSAFFQRVHSNILHPHQSQLWYFSVLSLQKEMLYELCTHSSSLKSLCFSLNSFINWIFWQWAECVSIV